MSIVEDPRWEAIEVLHDGVAVDRRVTLDAPLRERAVEADVGEPDIGMVAELGTECTKPIDERERVDRLLTPVREDSPKRLQLGSM